MPVFFEASTAGGIPIIKAVREAFVANHFTSFHGIINGTSNYILSRMTEAGLDFAQALAEAQAQGYAEADPTLDVNGWDAAHKAILLATLAYGIWIEPSEVSVQGIESVTAEDIAFARQLGWRIKLLASIRILADGGVSVGVHPTLIPEDHVLASVNGVFNAIALHGDVVGDALFYGRGAGGGRPPARSSPIWPMPPRRSSARACRAARACVRTRSTAAALPPEEVSIAVLSPPGGGRQTRRAGPGGGCAWPQRHRHLLRPAARAARRQRPRPAHPRCSTGPAPVRCRPRWSEIEALECVLPPARLLRVETLKG